MHNPPHGNWELLITAGNTDGMDGIFRSCLDKGDYVLFEDFGSLWPLSS